MNPCAVWLNKEKSASEYAGMAKRASYRLCRHMAQMIQRLTRMPRQRLALLLAAALVLGPALQPSPARADAPAALAAINDTADRVCGIIATQGETDSSKAQGEIHAELNGLARRLAVIGGSAEADIASSKYQGLLQQDLPWSLSDVRKCKLQVFEKLSTTLLPGTAQPTGPGAPAADLLQAPSNAPVVDTVRPNGHTELGLYSCANEAANIVCYITMTRLDSGQQDYRVDAINHDLVKLVDNFHIEHSLRRVYFIDGLGGHQQIANLSTGEGIWVAYEFDPGVHSISSARVIFNNLGGAQLRGAVN
jgi:hypothetical protein